MANDPLEIITKDTIIDPHVKSLQIAVFPM